jgi:hypothetical protein
MVPLYLYAGGERTDSFDKVLKKIKAKLERSKKKVCLPEAKKKLRVLEKQVHEILKIYK